MTERRSISPRPRLHDAGFRHEVRTLNLIAEALDGSLDLEHALEQTLVHAAALLRMHAGWIWLLDGESGRYYNAAVYNLPPYLQEPVQMTGKPCWCIQDLQNGELTPRNIAVLECSRLRTAVATGSVESTGGLHYHASIPLTSHGAALGIMNVAGLSWRRLTRTELRILATIGAQVSQAIERARLEREQVRLARLEERARLARDIHDTLAQGLTAIALHLDGALPYLADAPATARERVQKALHTTRDSLDQARQSVLGLRSGLPGSRPLAEALAALARAMTAETGVRVHVRAPVGDLASPHLEAELYRIAEEALANARRHAAARRVSIVVHRFDHAVGLGVRDDGIGFDPTIVDAARYGVIGMHERAALLGGRLRVISQPGQGTVVRIAAPYPPEGEREP